MKIYVSSILAGLFLSTAIAGNVFAADRNLNDALAIKTAKINLEQAINTAEHSFAGKASRAELERYHNKWVYDVEIVKMDKVMDVKVDSLSGKILSSADDAIDHDMDKDSDN